VTLLELSIVLVVLAVLAAVAVPSFSAAMDRGRLKSTAETLLADAAAAGRWCYAIATRPDCGCAAGAPACPGERLHRVGGEQHPAVAVLELRAIVFEPEGRAQPGGATLATARGEKLRVDTPSGGRSRICSPGGSVAGYPAC
jgi:hypothetical protein